MTLDRDTIKRINNAHRHAMKAAGLAQAVRDNGDRLLSAVVMRFAFLTERQAALWCAQSVDPTVEPTRSILLRSAASLAIDCREYEEAAALVEMGLNGNPPDEIRAELLELREKIATHAAQTAAQPSQPVGA